MAELPPPLLGPLVNDLGRTSGATALIAPVAFLALGVVTLTRAQLVSVQGVIGVLLVVVAVVLAMFALGPAVAIHEGGLVVRDPLFRSRAVAWAQVGEVRPPEKSTRHSFYLVLRDGSSVRIDRLSLRDRFGANEKYHPDVQAALDAYAEWQPRAKP